MKRPQAKRLLLAAMWLGVGALTTILMVGGRQLAGAAAVPVIAIVVVLAVVWGYFRVQHRNTPD